MMGNRTPVSCVTGRDTYHYTITDNCYDASTAMAKFQSNAFDNVQIYFIIVQNAISKKSFCEEN